ncbi:MAG: sigma-E processing peptidase SpoIIGA [Lachnospiraceae bacterium]|nr:sigma-E processing peptidase SpoIIGA [Lachnospiraceae bacterium]
MHRIVYPDLFFLLQLVLNYEIFRWEGRWLRREPGRYGPLVGAGLGSAGICFLQFGPLRAPVRQIFVFLLSLMIQKIAFPEMKGRELPLYTTVFWIASFLLSGILSFLAANTCVGAWFLRLRVSSQAGTEIRLRTLALTAAGVLFVGVSALLTGRMLRRLEAGRGHSANRFVPVTLIWNHRERTVTGLVDTGNTLRAPWNGQPVHILSRGVWKELGQIPAAQVRFVPYRSLGRAAGVLPAVTLDGMRIGGELYLEKPVVAISRTPVSGGDRYQMIISEEGLRE